VLKIIRSKAAGKILMVKILDVKLAELSGEGNIWKTNLMSMKRTVRTKISETNIKVSDFKNCC
jgi:hypothetical protein